MEEKKVFKYLKRFMPLIIVASLLVSLLISITLSNRRQYVASAVINYNYETAEEGKTPAGTTLDVNEIKASSIMSKVIYNLGLTDSYSVDNLTSRISIIEVPDADKVAKKDAMLEEGQEIVYVPTTYIVSFAASNSEGADFASSILDETLDTYFSVFGENYINVDYISNKIDKIYENNYDYIEMMELIDNSITDTVNVLYTREAASPYYRSTETGKTFEDLIDEFNYTKSVKVSDLFSRIFKYQITKNKDILLSKYTTRIDENKITSQNEKAMFDDTVEVIDRYVKKMAESGNTNINSDYILDNVYDKNVMDVPGDQTVTYDELIYGWRNHKLNDKLASIDSTYCNYVLDAFEKCTGNCGDKCKTSSQTCTSISTNDYDRLEKEISAEINSLVDDMSKLYADTVKTSDEYNEYLGCQNIQVLSSSSTASSINVAIYTIIVFIFLVVICAGGAVLIGRLNDIITVNFYTDKNTGFKNRAYLDKILKKKGRQNVDEGTVVISVAISNQREINDELGRDGGDAVIAYVASELRMAFNKMNAFFTYNGSSHFIVYLENTDHIEASDALQLFKLSLDQRETYNDIDIVLKTGMGEPKNGQISSARSLIVDSIKDYKEYESKATK